MSKKLSLEVLKIKSFVTEQSAVDSLTIKAGIAIGSDGPPTTSSRETMVDPICFKYHKTFTCPPKG